MRALLPIVAFALLWVPVSAASTSPTGSPTLTIVTVPAEAGVRFELGDSVFTTGADGTAEIAADPGTYLLRVLDETVRRPGVRSTFSRWGDNSFEPIRTVRIRGSTRLEVGFEQSVRVGFRFVGRSGSPVDTRRVSTVALASTIGTHESFRPDRERWLLAGRVTRRFRGLEQTRIQYAVERAVVDGSNVVNRSQQRFFPLQRRVVAVRLLLYSATVGAHDLIFGFPIGRSLELLYPNGQRATHELRGRQLVLNALPRGTYRIKVHTWGYSPVVSLALSKDQELELRIVSYLDLFVIALAVLGVTGTLVLLPRPALRKSLRALAVQAARVAVSRVAALARWARGACGRDGPVRRTSSRFLAFLGTGGVEPETVADDLDVATPSEEAQTNIAPRLPRWVPLPLDAPDPRSPQSSLFPSRLRAFPAAAVRYARNVAASGLSLSKPAATRSAEVARVPPGGRWAAPTLEVPVRAASSSPTVAPDAVVRYIRELISSGQTVPTRGLRRFRAEGGQIRTELWFELFESITRELAALNDTPDVSRPLAGPMRAAIRYQIASGERR